MARLLVDGMNVLGARPDGWWRDRPGAVARLVAALDAFAAATGDEVRVVFDGRPVAVGAPERVDVRFAARRGRDAADDVVAAVAAADADPGSLVVVTSDAALAARVRAAGARVEGAGGFRRRLDAPAQPR
ncbi:MAG TPA: NYN domain-containing protein [Solirubrobacteraceae bacterium]|nr:NYN domain-containing protein [Solirubrobacteraceae bacterium]